MSESDNKEKGNLKEERPKSSKASSKLHTKVEKEKKTDQGKKEKETDQGKAKQKSSGLYPVLDEFSDLTLLDSAEDELESEEEEDLEEAVAACERERENKGLGSSGIDLAYLSLNLDEHLIITLKIEGKDFPGLLDTGADRSIIRKEDWLKRWPLQASSQTLQGLGYAKAPEISAKELTWTYQEGQEGKFQPFVVELPITLWGRDVLSQMNFMLTTEYSEASRNMMRNSGFIPGKGLGKHLQGMAEPLVPIGKQDHRGLDFS
ncbi:hypothetical protein STEG23_026560 [Scotinomys teguina]